MNRQSKKNIRQSVRFTLEKYNVRDVTPANLRRVLSALGYETVRLTRTEDSEENGRLAECGITRSDLRDGARTVCRDGHKYVFLADDAADCDILRLLARSLGYIVLCDPINGLYGETSDDEATAEEFSRCVVGITKHSSLYNTVLFHPSAAVGVLAALIAAAVMCFALFGSPASLFTKDAGTPEERAIPVSAEPSAKQEVYQKPLQIDAEGNTPARMSELEGVPDAAQTEETDVTVPSSGFIPLAPTDDLPGFDASVTEAGTAAQSERLIPSAEPQTGTVTERLAPASSSEEAPASFTPSGYVATGSGTKYHVPDCSYVKNKTTRAVSIEDINAGKYTACSRCIK